jgi:hypothetical protein
MFDIVLVNRVELGVALARVAVGNVSRARGGPSAQVECAPPSTYLRRVSIASCGHPGCSRSGRSRIDGRGPRASVTKMASLRLASSGRPWEP